MVGLLLSVTFACGLVVAGAHVVNRRFLAPVYDVVANLTAFACAVAASILLHHWLPAVLALGAVSCWLWLAWRTLTAIRHGQPRLGQAALSPGTTTSRPRVRARRARSTGSLSR